MMILLKKYQLEAVAEYLMLRTRSLIIHSFYDASYFVLCNVVLTRQSSFRRQSLIHITFL